MKEIDAGLQRSQKRDKFQLEQVWAVTPGDVQRAMLDYNPHSAPSTVTQAAVAGGSK